MLASRWDEVRRADKSWDQRRICERSLGEVRGGDKRWEDIRWAEGLSHWSNWKHRVKRWCHLGGCLLDMCNLNSGICGKQSVAHATICGSSRDFCWICTGNWSHLHSILWSAYHQGSQWRTLYNDCPHVRPLTCTNGAQGLCEGRNWCRWKSVKPKSHSFTARLNTSSGKDNLKGIFVGGSLARQNLKMSLSWAVIWREKVPIHIPTVSTLEKWTPRCYLETWNFWLVPEPKEYKSS